MADMFEGDSVGYRSALLDALEDFRQAADLLLQHGSKDPDVKTFYCTLFARCWNFRQSLDSTTDSISIREWVHDALNRLESLIVHCSASCASQDEERRTFPGLKKLNNLLTMRFDDLQSKSKALQDCIVFGDEENQSAILDMLLEGYKAAEIRTQTETFEIEHTPPTEIRENPPDNVQFAARSLCEVLRAKRECTCKPVHKYVVQLSLGTHRTPVPSCDFDLYFGLEQKWHEARVQTNIHACSEVPRVSVQHQTKVDGTDTSTADEAERRLVRKLCKEVIKTTRRFPGHRLNFALEKDKLWKLQSEESDFVIDKSKAPISLAQLLNDNLFMLNERVKRILSVLLGYAVLYLHDTSWLSPTWGSESVMFFESFDGIPMRPYIRTPLNDNGTSDDFSSATMNNEDKDEDDDDYDDPDNGLIPRYPCLVGLAVVLMEIHNASPFGILADTCDVTLSDEHDLAAQFINARDVFRRYKHQFTDKTRKAIEACLDPKIGDRGDNLHNVIYRHIVSLLEDELEQGFSEFPVNELDSLIRDLNLANGGQRMLKMNTPNMILRGSASTPTRFQGKGNSNRRVRFQEAKGNKVAQISQSTHFQPIEGDIANDYRQLSGKQIRSLDKTMVSYPALIKAGQKSLAPTVSKKPQDHKPSTLRVMNIPDDMSSLQLCRNLEQQFAFDCKVHSLTRASRNTRWKKYATVTFPQMPNRILDDTIEKLRHQVLENNFDFDQDFLGLTPLYDGGDFAISDIIAIEGLGTNPFGTFRSPLGDLMWLRDFLPESFSSSRVLLYGYDSKVLDSPSNQSVKEIATTCKNFVMNFRRITKTDGRPIIWLGQSMGGLIVQEILVQASQYRSRNWSGNLLAQTIGFLGYGVPINGLQHESLLNAVKAQPNYEMIESICLDEDGRPSRYLEDLANRFALCTENISVHHFYETNPSPDIWVPEATLRRRVDHQEVVGRENRYWVPRNHSDLVKVSSKMDLVYIITEQVISLIHSEHEL